MLYPTPRDPKLVTLEIGTVFLKILSTSHPHYLADPYPFKEDCRTQMIYSYSNAISYFILLFRTVDSNDIQLGWVKI